MDPAVPCGMASAPLSERFERSWLGRTVISVGIVLVLVAEIGIHLPSSALERAVSEPSNRSSGSRRRSSRGACSRPTRARPACGLEARVTLDDGSTHWDAPGGPTDRRQPALLPLAEVARARPVRRLPRSGIPPRGGSRRSTTTRGRPVVRVELIRRFHENVVDGDQPPWQAFTFYTLDLRRPDTSRPMGLPLSLGPVLLRAESTSPMTLVRIGWGAVTALWALTLLPDVDPFLTSGALRYDRVAAPGAWNPLEWTSGPAPRWSPASLLVVAASATMVGVPHPASAAPSPCSA